MSRKFFSFPKFRVPGFSLFRRKRHRSLKDLEVEALGALLAGRTSRGLKLLLEIAHRDTSRLEVFWRIGEIYREQGDALRAAGIHRDLLTHEDLSPPFRLMVLTGLVKDYQELGDHHQAIEYATQILELDRKNRWAARAIREARVALRDWEGAVEAFQQEKKLNPDLDPQLPALYKTYQAVEQIRAGNQSEAKSLLRQAIKLGLCAAPYYYLGLISRDEGQFRHAVDYLTTFAELDPQRGVSIFPEIEKLYFELGEFEEVERFYRRLRRKQPNNPDVLLGLASYYERKGEVREALNLLEEIPTDKADTLILLALLRLYGRLGKTKEMLKEMEQYLQEQDKQRYRTCHACGYTSDQLLYICPQCGHLEIQ